MCAHTQLKNKNKKILQGYSTERPKIGVSGVKDTTKTNKD